MSVVRLNLLFTLVDLKIPAEKTLLVNLSTRCLMVLNANVFNECKQPLLVEN